MESTLELFRGQIDPDSWKVRHVVGVCPIYLDLLKMAYYGSSISPSTAQESLSHQSQIRRQTRRQKSTANIRCFLCPSDPWGNGLRRVCHGTVLCPLFRFQVRSNIGSSWESRHFTASGHANKSYV